MTGLRPLELTGRATTHVIAVNESGLSLEPCTAAAFDALVRSARNAGFDPLPVSGFRSFERQLAIWNAKFRGQRLLLDRAGRPLRALDLDVGARVNAILCWSALPGASRHHWGTEIDLVDRAALTGQQQPQLIAAEYAEGGPFAPFAAWLEKNARRFGFYRPYRVDRGGVAPEPWHYSFAPRARLAERALTPSLLRECLASAAIEGGAWLLERVEELHRRYVAAVDPPPRMRSRWTRESDLAGIRRRSGRPAVPDLS